MIHNYEDLLARLRNMGFEAGKALAILLAFWIASRILELAIRRFLRPDRSNSDLIRLLGRTAKIAIQAFGVITALGSAGINVEALVAGLGLTGFALGFALRDILSNVIAGVLVLLYRPFTRGDRISITGFDGAVTEIDLRYTILESEGKTILIPNSNLFTNPIVVTHPKGSTPPRSSVNQPA